MGAQYGQQAGEGLPLSMSHANEEVLRLATNTGQHSLQHPTQTAEKVAEKVVKVAKTARDALRGKDIVKDAVERAQCEVKGTIEQARKSNVLKD